MESMSTARLRVQTACGGRMWLDPSASLKYICRYLVVLYTLGTVNVELGISKRIPLEVVTTSGVVRECLGMVEKYGGTR